jgi:hypothetical protein
VGLLIQSKDCRSEVIDGRVFRGKMWTPKYGNVVSFLRSLDFFIRYNYLFLHKILLLSTLVNFGFVPFICCLIPSTARFASFVYAQQSTRWFLDIGGLRCREFIGNRGQGAPNARDGELRSAYFPLVRINIDTMQCDERKPSCANCDRNSLQCSLEFLTPMTSLSRGKFVNYSLHTAPVTPSKQLYPFMPSPTPGLSSSPFDVQTTELLHHYTTIAYISLSGNRKPSVWRVAMPQMGLAHPFLLSGILAISALHLSTILPHRKQELQNFAIAQESAALPSFRESIRNPNAETIHAIFAFAGSVVYYIMASPEVLPAGQTVDRCRLPSRDDAHPHWFQTMRGLMALLAKHWAELAKGPFGPLLDGDPGPNYASDNPDDEQLAKLEGLFSASSLLSCPLLPPSPDFGSSFPSLIPQEERKLELLREALTELRRVSALPHSPNRTLCVKTSAYMWPGSVSQDFVELIYERDPRALVLLAHYCILLKRNNHVWYLRGLGAGLLENIWQALGEDWRPWIQWAMEQSAS